MSATTDLPSWKAMLIHDSYTVEKILGHEFTKDVCNWSSQSLPRPLLPCVLNQRNWRLCANPQVGQTYASSEVAWLRRPSRSDIRARREPPVRYCSLRPLEFESVAHSRQGGRKGDLR